MIWITIINCSNMELMLLWTGDCFLLKGFQYGLPITALLLLKLLTRALPRWVWHFSTANYFFSIFQKTFFEKKIEKNFFSPFLL